MAAPSVLTQHTENIPSSPSTPRNEVITHEKEEMVLVIGRLAGGKLSQLGNQLLMSYRYDDLDPEWNGFYVVLPWGHEHPFNLDSYKWKLFHYSCPPRALFGAGDDSFYILDEASQLSRWERGERSKVKCASIHDLSKVICQGEDDASHLLSFSNERLALFNPNSQCIYLGNLDAHGGSWKADENQIVWEPRVLALGNPITAFTLHGDVMAVARYGVLEYSQITDMNTIGVVINIRIMEESYVSQLTFTEDGTRLIMLYATGLIECLTLEARTVSQLNPQQPVRPDSKMCLQGDRLAVGSAVQLEVWSLSTFERLNSFVLETEPEARLSALALCDTTLYADIDDLLIACTL